MTKFQPNQSASAAHAALKNSLHTMEKAKDNAVLWFAEILQRKLYRELGYGTINQYARQELGFSTSRVGDFLSICSKLDQLPRLRQKLKEGKLGYTQAREVVKVADPKNQEQWLQFAENNSRRELAKEVKRARQTAVEQKAGQPSLLPVAKPLAPASPPVRVTLELSPTQFARFEALWEKIRKQGAVPADKVEALLEILAVQAAESSPRGDVSGPPAQIHIHQCPECKKASVQTGKGELILSEAELEKAQCDSRITTSPGRNKASIAPKTRREVLARDRHRCRRKGCGNNRFLEVHHLVQRAAGGSNEASNLVTLCSACHSLLHDRGGALAEAWLDPLETRI